jgi:outer membrane protein
VGLSVEFPLLPNGDIQSKYRAAEQIVKQARLELEANARSVEQKCTTKFYAFQAAQKNAAAAKIALNANQVALEAGHTQYALGLNTLNDMIQIEETWLKTVIQYINSAAILIKTSYEVLELMGKLTAEDLYLDVNLYDNFKYYNDYHDAWLSLGQDEYTSPLMSTPH